MKRRFAAILFLIFFGLFLAGCDGMTLPSGETLPTTTSATEAPTSGGETTAIPTTAVPTSGGETTAVPTTAVP
ncbi:MAG: hypothetical protein RBQ86_06675, partial [Candidatus Izemoplasmatales bacterium]|nr:hypothetical protein [Candidatus Izemoplasmatales bacterium]